MPHGAARAPRSSGPCSQTHRNMIEAHYAQGTRGVQLLRCNGREVFSSGPKGQCSFQPWATPREQEFPLLIRPERAAQSDAGFIDARSLRCPFRTQNGPVLFPQALPGAGSCTDPSGRIFRSWRFALSPSESLIPRFCATPCGVGIRVNAQPRARYHRVRCGELRYPFPSHVPKQRSEVYTIPSATVRKDYQREMVCRVTTTSESERSHDDSKY